MASMRGVLLGSAPPPISDARGVRFRPTGMSLHGEKQPSSNWSLTRLNVPCVSKTSVFDTPRTVNLIRTGSEIKPKNYRKKTVSSAQNVSQKQSQCFALRNGGNLTNSVEKVTLTLL
jgi:hypothetical protein